MEFLDLIWDVCIFVSGIACTCFAVVRRKRFDPWVSLPICMAWVLKGVRHLYYDWMLAAIKNAGEHEVFLHIQKTNMVVGAADTVIMTLLFAALTRVAIVWRYSRWYSKVIQSPDQ